MQTAVFKKKPLILIVDDEGFMRRVLRTVLEKADFAVEEAEGGEEALAVFEQQQIDLVLLDLVMPGLDGAATCREMRKRPGGNHVPIMMLTGAGDTRSIHKAFEAGATDFIVKPINSDLLAYRVRYALRASQLSGELITSRSMLKKSQSVAGLGYWMLEGKSRQFWWSDEIYRIFQLEPEGQELCYDRLRGYVHPEDRPLFEENFRIEGEKSRPFDFHYRIILPDGSVRIVHHQGEIARSLPGLSLQMFGTMQDITERRRAEEKLILLKEAIDCLPIGVTISDTEGKTVYANPAEAQIHGYGPEDLLGRDAGALLPVELRDRLTLEGLAETGVWRGEGMSRRKDGEPFPVQLSSIAIRNTDGQILGTVTACEDISERKAAEAKIEQLAYYDPLTGLMNRRVFQDRLHQALGQAQREERQVAVLFLDLDRFKEVNDSFGHDFGDQLLQEVAGRLAACMRQADTLARLGGDEFVVVITNIVGQEGVATAAQRILDAFASPFSFKGRQLHIGASIGIALFPGDGREVGSLLQSADAAMYHAKAQGRQTYRFYSEEVNRKIRERTALENNLRLALEREEFSINYQPQIDLESRRVVGVEALVRWQNPELGLVLPDQFIPIAEETGLIFPIGEWVMRRACREAQGWCDGSGAPLRLALNISGHQFKHSDFLSMVDALLHETGYDPRHLELELTESVLMDRAEETLASLRALKAKGIHLCIDDFGTGYSSLSYLKHFPVDRIKIDRTFVKDLATNADDASIVEAIISMSHSLRLKVLAEGVEDARQLRFLIARGCQEIQGYYFGRPVPAAQFTEQLRRIEKALASGQDEGSKATGTFRNMSTPGG